MEAIECNTQSLKELNAYIDRLESPDTVKAPFVSRTIQFFKPQVKKSGEVISGSLKPCSITLPSLTPSVDLLEKEDASVRLIHEIEKAMEHHAMFSAKSYEQESIEPIIKRSPKGVSVRSELDAIWEREALNDRIKTSIFGAVDERLSQRREYHSILIYNKLMKKYGKIKNWKRRQRRMADIEDQVEAQLAEKHIPSSLDMLETEQDPEYETKVKIIESGFHPDLVFFDKDLCEADREEGIARVCGVNLTEESDTWLLENVWKAVRLDQSPAVPIVLGTRYEADLGGGYLRIPFNFILSDLVDFLEENLDAVREGRKALF